MQYYTFKLDKASSMLCTITMPFGLYCYLRLPMDILESPNIAQEIMERLLANCDCEVYIDDIGVFSKTWKEHITKLNKILHILQDANFTINPLKCEWAVQETDWLGHWLTKTGKIETPNTYNGQTAEMFSRYLAKSNDGPRRLFPFNLCSNMH